MTSSDRGEDRCRNSRSRRDGATHPIAATDACLTGASREPWVSRLPSSPVAPPSSGSVKQSTRRIAPSRLPSYGTGQAATSNVDVRVVKGQFSVPVHGQAVVPTTHAVVGRGPDRGLDEIDGGAVLDPVTGGNRGVPETDQGLLLTVPGARWPDRARWPCRGSGPVRPGSRTCSAGSRTLRGPTRRGS